MALDAIAVGYTWAKQRRRPPAGCARTHARWGLVGTVDTVDPLREETQRSRATSPRSVSFVTTTDTFDLHDDLVGLRAMVPADAVAIMEACQDDEIIRWTSIPSPYTLEFAHTFISLAAQWRAEGSSFQFAVINLGDGSFAGTIGLDAVLRPPAQVGYWIAPWARRQGFASRALTLVTSWAIRELGVETIELVTKIGNEASERVAGNAGFAFVDEIAEHQPMYGSETVRVRRWALPHT